MCHRRTGIENRQGNGWCTLRDDLERREALEAVGHEVLVAPDGMEGARIYRKQPVDLVITDILMPEKEGLECILELRRLNPALRVIAISGGLRSGTIDVLDVARRFGACRTFWKPFDLASIVSAVQVGRMRSLARYATPLFKPPKLPLGWRLSP